MKIQFVLWGESLGMCVYNTSQQIGWGMSYFFLQYLSDLDMLVVGHT